MPKKRNYDFKQLQGTSSSAANGRPGSSKNGSVALEKSASVNERLVELRKIEGSEAAQVKRDLAEAVNQRSVPPQLRGILGVPESAPPKPKFGIRHRVTGPRVAGPAPPDSWLRSRSTNWSSLPLPIRARRFRKSIPGVKDRSRPGEVWAFARKTGFASDLQVGRSPGSLMHLALKATAELWDLFDEADYAALVDLDLRLRIRLLSYIGVYGPAISVKGLEALLQGSEPVRFLDLAGLLGHSTLTSARLVKSAKAQVSGLPTEHRVADSWDEDDSFESAIAPSLSPSRFSHLTHLCLSHPLSTVSWRDLLSLSKQTPQVTHLSLAYWPRPTLTPNLATVSISDGRSPDVRAGGSHYYSALDRDSSEAASLLRQLSANLLCLQWLDLEGCADWMHPLAVNPDDSPVDGNRAGDVWSHSRPRFNSPFLDHWKNVTYLACSQGWLPSKSGIDALPRQTMNAFERNVALEFLKTELPLDASNEDADQLYQIAQRKAAVWMSSEVEAVRWCHAISVSRRDHHLKPLLIDHGWRTKFTYM